MDYFQGVVAEYLRANRQTFVDPEFLLQLDGPASNPQKGAHWYVDLSAVNLKKSAVYLCEVSYSGTLAALLKKLSAWDSKWTEIAKALQRDACVGADWHVRPWIFVPSKSIASLVPKLGTLKVPPKITPLEMTQPWQFCTWDRAGEADKRAEIPETMQ